jgi:predicted Zn-dependent peptidase
MKRAIWRALSTVCLGALLPLPALAQGHETEISKVVRLNRAPVNKEILRIQLPRPRKTRLGNGLEVLVLERHKLPTVAFTLWIKSGALDDPPALPGLAKFTAEMLHEGTTHRTSAQVAAQVDSLGATLEASAPFGFSTSRISAAGLVENTDRILELMSDAVLNPTFPQDELDKYKTRQLAALEHQRSEPGFLAQEMFHKVLYRDFPAAEVSATPDSVKHMTAEELKRFHDDTYLPNNSILGVVGDVTYDQIVPAIEKYFGAWKEHPVSRSGLHPLAPPASSRVVLVDRPGSVQTNIMAGDYSVRRADPDFIPLRVMNEILGAGPASRLFLDLREEKGYTYGAYSSFSSDIFPGPWVAQTEVRTPVTDGSLNEMLALFKQIREQNVPQEELGEAQRALVASFALSLERPAALLDAWMTVSYFELPDDYWDSYPEQVAKVSPQVIQEMAKKYVDLAHLQIVCVGDGKQIKDVLKKYGPLEIYDADGKRQE